VRLVKRAGDPAGAAGSRLRRDPEVLVDLLCAPAGEG
jgi:hypothetical protein